MSQTLIKKKEKGKSALKTISMMIMLIVTTGGFLLMLSHERLLHQKLNSIGYAASHKTLLMCWRYAVYLTVIFLWPKCMRYLGKRNHGSQENIDYLAKQRLFVLLFFAIIELFFADNLLGHAISMLS